MIVSEARLAANRRNALRSTGPRTPEGKERSRANALKHGLTGRGIALPDEDAAEVARRFEALAEEMRPSGELGNILVRRVAVLSVRLDRCARHEAAATSARMRDARVDFDDRRLTDVEQMIAGIAAEPATYARRLRTAPEGVDAMIAGFLAVKDDLTHPTLPRWDYDRWQRVENLMGRRPEDFALSRVGELAKAASGDFASLRPDDAVGLDEPARRAWARDRLVEVIDAEVATLRAHRETLDLAAIEADRAEAGTRALFDPSREATLARKYEAAAERGLYRALREFRQVEDEAADRAEEAGPDAVPELGSFSPEPDREAGEGAKPRAEAPPHPIPSKNRRGTGSRSAPDRPSGAPAAPSSGIRRPTGPGGAA